MMVGKLLLLGFVVVFLHNTSPVDTVDYFGQQVWEITPKSEADLESLKQLSDDFNDLDFWSHPSVVYNPVSVRLTPSQMKKVASFLGAHNLDYDVTIGDVQAAVNAQFSGSRSPRMRRDVSLENFDYSVYHPPEDIYDWIDMVTDKYDFVHKKQVAVTFEGRPMYVLEITKESSNPKPVIYIDALIHCREWITTATMIKIFHDMLTTNSSLLDDIDWYFVPMVNVDGYVETWTGDRLWRKTRSTGANSQCVGVDGNRNWDDHWSGPGANSADPCSIVFYGPTPASESEVRHLQNYIINKNINAVLSMHSCSQLILYPFSYDFNLPSNNDELNATAKLMHDAIKSVHGETYIYGPGAATIYRCSGVTTDWTYNEAKINMSYTFEFRDTGKYCHLLPEENIIPSSEEIFAAIETFASVIEDDFLL